MLEQVNSLIVDGTIAVIHFGPYRLEPVSSASCDHAVVALDFSSSHMIDDLWQLLPASRLTEWSLYSIRDKLYLLEESAGYFKMDQVDI